MPNDILKLSDKRVVLSGPIRSYSYEIGYSFTSQGASICFLTPETDKAQRICDTLNEAREIHRSYGRATYAPLPLETPPENVSKTVAAAVHTISGLDIYIDGLNFFQIDESTKILNIHILNAVEHILLERSKGRIIFLIENFLYQNPQYNSSFKEHRASALNWVESHQNTLLEKNICAHVVRIELSEDTLLHLFPKLTLNQGLQETNKNHNNLKMTKPDNISKILLAVCGDLMSPSPPMDFVVQ
jgi:hypothetical protein